MSFSDLLQKKLGNPEGEFTEFAQADTKGGGLENFIQRHGGVTQEYSFYGGEVTLRFDKEAHRYYRVGELGELVPVDGVTTVVGIINNSQMLTPWAAKVTIQKLLRLIPTELIDGVIRIKPLTLEDFTVLALEAKTAPRDKLDEAGDIGKIAHRCIEDSINHAMQTDPQKIVRNLINLPEDEQACNAAQSALSWMLQHNVRWQETETKIYSREHDYAGQCDGLGMCDSCGNEACCPEPFKDSLAIIDWKSSNHLKIQYLFQVAGAYRHAKLAEFPHLKIDRTFILRLGKSEEEAGKFEPWHTTVDYFPGFLACLQLVRLVKAAEDDMKLQKGVIKAVKKVQRETAKALALEQTKLAKALEKAEAKRVREEEKEQIKTLARAEREARKVEHGAIKPLV